MKAKSFHCSKNGVAQPIAAAIGSTLQCVSDKMPPAYPCEGEKVVFIGVEMNGKLPSDVEKLCKELVPARTRSVAFYVINGKGSDEGLQPAIDLVEANGVKKVGETLKITVKSSFFKKGSVTDNDVQTAVAWAKEIANMDI